MTHIFSSLHARISVIVLLVVTVLGALLISLSQDFNHQSNLQTLQGVNRSVAMYVTGQQPLITDKGIQEQTVSTLTERAMVINPSLEIYILDNSGKIISHRMGDERVLREQVSMQPVRDFLGGDVALPIVGDDPLRLNQPAVFSVSPITFENQQYGYVYAIIGAGMYRDLQQEASAEGIQSLYLWLAISVLVVAVVIALILVAWVTQPLSRLREDIEHFSVDQWDFDRTIPSKRLGEVSVLQRTFSQMRQTIATQMQAIEQNDKTRRELIANVSHDLRTPLAAMQGSLELLLLKQNELAPQDADRHLQGAFNQSQRLTTLVGDLFELAKLESGALTPQLERFFVLELLQDCSHDLASLAVKKNIQLRLDIQQGVNPQVNADIGLIQRVLENLITNAIQHTPENGVVTLSVQSDEQGVKVAVSDNGMGIDSADIPHIFDRFYQAKHTEHSSRIGSGLGLAIVKRILAAHQASIEVTSRLKEGTRFEFELAAAY